MLEYIASVKGEKNLIPHICRCIQPSSGKMWATWKKVRACACVSVSREGHLPESLNGSCAMTTDPVFTFRFVLPNLQIFQSQNIEGLLIERMYVVVTRTKQEETMQELNELRSENLTIRERERTRKRDFFVFWVLYSLQWPRGTTVCCEITCSS